MDNLHDSDQPDQNDSDNPENPGPLRRFVEGLSEKIGPEFKRIADPEEKREVKREIAHELGVEEAYTPHIRSTINGSEDTLQARWEVDRRYDELRSNGKIVEVGEAAEQTKRFEEWIEEIKAELSTEECSEDSARAECSEPPDRDEVDWGPGVPQIDPSDAV